MEALVNQIKNISTKASITFNTTDIKKVTTVVGGIKTVIWEKAKAEVITLTKDLVVITKRTHKASFGDVTEHGAETNNSKSYNVSYSVKGYPSHGQGVYVQEDVSCEGYIDLSKLPERETIKTLFINYDGRKAETFELTPGMDKIEFKASASNHDSNSYWPTAESRANGLSTSATAGVSSISCYRYD
jgi:hypothetical protein